jgi:peptide/nickel transport system substrate-binding protein
MNGSNDRSDSLNVAFVQHQMTRRAFVQQTGLSVSALMFLIACGNTSSGTTGPLTELKIGYATEPGTLDPHLMQGVNEGSVLTNIMEGLIMLDHNNVPQLRLAESYKQLDDLTWQFNLRKGVTFHNGEPLTSQSVKVSYDRSRTKTLPIKNTWSDDINLDHIEIVDDTTVKFHLTAPTPFLLARMANDHLLFPPKYLANSDAATIGRRPVGTGQYMFKEWVSGSSVSFEANPKYWGSNKARIGKVTFQVIPDQASRVNNLKTGAVQLINSLDPESTPLVKGQSGLKIASVQAGRRVYAGFNTKLKPMDDVRVRQAINYGTDVESICKTVLGGLVTRMKTWAEVPYADPSVKGYSYDPEKAKSLLKDAGVSNLKITFDVDNSPYLGSSQFPEAIAASLAKIGVTVAINRIDKAVARETQTKRTTHEMYLRSNAAYYDVGLTYSILKLTQAGNGTQWNDPQFQDLLKKILSGGTDAERKNWGNQMQARLMDQAPMLFLWVEPSIFGYDSRKLATFNPTPDEHIHVENLS